MSAWDRSDEKYEREIADLRARQQPAEAIRAYKSLLDSAREMADEMRRVEYNTRHYLCIDGPLFPEEWKRRDPASYATWERAVDAIAEVDRLAAEFGGGR